MFYSVLLLLTTCFIFATSFISAFRTDSYDYDNVSDANYNSSTPDDHVVCDGVGYNIGKWVPRNFKEDPAQNFACCGEGVGNSIVCNDNTIPSNEEHGCNCERQFYKDNNISTAVRGEKSRFNPQSVNYDWVPINCELASWNAYEFLQGVE